MTKEIWVAPIVKEQLTKIRKRVINKDRDFVLVIDGEEGSGKSVLAQQIALFFYPNFTLDNIVFNSDQFLKIIKDPKTKKGTCIILDEAMASASSRGSLSEVNRSMQAVASEMRQKNLFIIFCIPSFFDLDKYFALWRCRALFHIYFDESENRRYIIFPKDHKKGLYLTGKKTYNYSKPRSPYPPFQFPHEYAVDEEDYREKKAQAFNKRVISNQARKWLLQRNAYIKYIIQTLGLAQEDVAKIPQNYGYPTLSQQNMSVIMKELTETDK